MCTERDADHGEVEYAVKIRKLASGVIVVEPAMLPVGHVATVRDAVDSPATPPHPRHAPAPSPDQAPTLPLGSPG